MEKNNKYGNARPDGEADEDSPGLENARKQTTGLGWRGIVEQLVLTIFALAFGHTTQRHEQARADTTVSRRHIFRVSLWRARVHATWPRAALATCRPLLSLAVLVANPALGLLRSSSYRSFCIRFRSTPPPAQLERSQIRVTTVTLFVSLSPPKK